MSKIEIVH